MLKHSLALAVVLFGVWLLWSGHFVAMLVTIGALSSLSVVALVRRMGVVDEESVPLRVTARAAAYAPWLAWQIVKSNLVVARIILTPRLRIRPRLIRVHAGQRTDLGRVIYANSITLTPGTVSIAVDQETITVHALADEAAADVLDGEMDRRASRVEGRTG